MRGLCSSPVLPLILVSLVLSCLALQHAFQFHLFPLPSSGSHELPSRTAPHADHQNHDLGWGSHALHSLSVLWHMFARPSVPNGCYMSYFHLPHYPVPVESSVTSSSSSSSPFSVDSVSPALH